MTNLASIFAAIIIIESGGKDIAYNETERAVGCAQIRQAVLDDVNRLYHTTYEPWEMFDRARSFQVFCLYVNHYASRKKLGRKPRAEDIARIWNGGPRGHRKKSTLRYWHKVAEAYAKLAD